MYRYKNSDRNWLKIGILSIALALVVGYLVDDLTGTTAVLPGVVTGKFSTRATYGRYRVVMENEEEEARQPRYYLQFDVDGAAACAEVEYSTWRNARIGAEMTVQGNFGRLTHKFYAHDAW